MALTQLWGPEGGEDRAVWGRFFSVPTLIFDANVVAPIKVNQAPPSPRGGLGALAQGASSHPLRFLVEQGQGTGQHQA